MSPVPKYTPHSLTCQGDYKMAKLKKEKKSKEEKEESKVFLGFPKKEKKGFIKSKYEDHPKFQKYKKEGN